MMCLLCVLVLWALCSEVFVGSTDTARHYVTVTSTWVLLSAFAHCGATSFTFTSTFTSVEDLVNIVVRVLVDKVKPGFTSAFAFTFALEELTDLTYRLAHMLSPVGLGFVVGPVQVCVQLGRG